MARSLAFAALVLGILAALAQIASFIRDIWNDTKPEIAMQQPNVQARHARQTAMRSRRCFASTNGMASSPLNVSALPRRPA
jgi:hypothetical protein